MWVWSYQKFTVLKLTREHAETGQYVLEIENGEVASGTASAVAISCFSGELHFDQVRG